MNELGYFSSFPKGLHQLVISKLRRFDSLLKSRTPLIPQGMGQRNPEVVMLTTSTGRFEVSNTPGQHDSRCWTPLASLYSGRVMLDQECFACAKAEQPLI